MPKRKNPEMEELREIEHALVETLNGDPCVEYCNINEDPDDLEPRMRMAADEAKLRVVRDQIERIVKKNKRQVEKMKRRPR